MEKEYQLGRKNDNMEKQKNSFRNKRKMYVITINTVSTFRVRFERTDCMNI